MDPIERVEEIRSLTECYETMCEGNLASLPTELFTELCDIATKALKEAERRDRWAKAWKLSAGEHRDFGFVAERYASEHQTARLRLTAEVEQLQEALKPVVRKGCAQKQWQQNHGYCKDSGLNVFVEHKEFNLIEAAAKEAPDESD